MKRMKVHAFVMIDQYTTLNICLTKIIIFMKKVLLLFGLAMASASMNAQITLEGTWDGDVVKGLDYEDQYFDAGVICISEEDTLLTMYNEDLSLYKQLRFPSSSTSIAARRSPSAVQGSASLGFYLISRNIFTTDNKVAFVHWDTNNLTICDEDGTILYNLCSSDNYPRFGIMQVNGNYKLWVRRRIEMIDAERWLYSYQTSIYSLPGHGDIETDVKEISSHTQNIPQAYKIVENGQIYIVLDGVKYAVTGMAKE